jgi:hypothetical protein
MLTYRREVGEVRESLVAEVRQGKAEAPNIQLTPPTSCDNVDPTCFLQA